MVQAHDDGLRHKKNIWVQKKNPAQWRGLVLGLSINEEIEQSAAI